MRLRTASVVGVACIALFASSCGSDDGGAPSSSTTSVSVTTVPRQPARDVELDAAMRHLVAIDLVDKPAPSQGEGTPGEMDMKGPHPLQPLGDPQRQAVLDQQLAAAREAAARYPRLQDAIGAGYIPTPISEPGVGVHAVNWGLVDEFDPYQPAMLLYSDTAPSARIVALSYYIVSDPDQQPDGFEGTSDHWHNHIDICIRNGELLPTTHKPDECNEQAGTYLTGRNLWMLHAWVVDSEPNPWGVFATYNPRYDNGEGNQH